MTGRAIIVGSGIAGATLACLLAQAGHPVLLLERERTARPKVCGEFLSQAALVSLERLGLDPLSLGGRKVARLRISRGRRTIDAPLPFAGLSLSRDVLDAALLQRAINAGAQVRCGHAVRHIKKVPEPALVMDDGCILSADTVFLASGKHDIRGLERPKPPGSDLIGLKMHFDLTEGQASALDGQISLFLFAGGYAGLSRLCDNKANLSLLIARDHFAAFNHDWNAMLTGLRRQNERLDQCLSNAVPLFPKPAAIYRQPFGFLAKPDNGIFRLGDQMVCVPSFSGDGISVAFHSAFRAADIYLRGGDAVAYHASIRRDLTPQLIWGRTIGSLIRSSIGQGLLMQATYHMPALLTLAMRRTRLDAASSQRAGPMRMSGTSLLSS